MELQIKDGNGNIVDGKSGWAIRKRTYDAKKNCLTETYYNAKNQLAEDEDKVAKYEYVYDEKDNMIEVKSYNKQGKPFSPVFKAVYKYDEKNNCIEIICLDKDNAPAQNSFGTYRINYEYDKAGELAKCKYYNKAGTLIAVTDAEGNRLDKSATASEIRDYAESISESCPAVIVDGLIFANAFHASGNEMQLIWKLDGMRKSDISEAEINELRTAIRQIALENGVVQNCREFKVRVVINVFDDNMDEIFKVTV